MDLKTSPTEERHREEVQAFIAAELTPDLRKAGRNCSGIYCDYPVANRWHRILARRGWSVTTWPVQFGGVDWTPMQQYIFESEMAQAGAPQITPNSTRFVAPAIMEFGTDEQKARYLPAIRLGDDWWAQGYSEPGAGSDLAALSCAAVRDGDHFIINGSKIWTTHAHFSNRIFCLVRTKREIKPQLGISFMLFDLDLPGIEICPILSMSGEHELNQVFFRDVRVPASALLGAENGGWTVAKYLLQHERSVTWSPVLRARASRLRVQCAQLPGNDAACLLDEPAFAQQLAALEIELRVLEVSELQMLCVTQKDRPVSSGLSSMMKIRGTELRQRLSELSVLAHARAAACAGSIDDEGLRLGAQAVALFLNDRAASIYGGTNEIQRNILAKLLLQ